eukprot:15470264-Alexandrium_andersonii.AAC.1
MPASLHQHIGGSDDSVDMCTACPPCKAKLSPCTWPKGFTEFDPTAHSVTPQRAHSACQA